MVFETAIFSNKFNVNGSVVAEQVSKGAFVLGRCDITLCGGHIFFLSKCPLNTIFYTPVVRDLKKNENFHNFFADFQENFSFFLVLSL